MHACGRKISEGRLLGIIVEGDWHPTRQEGVVGLSRPSENAKIDVLCKDHNRRIIFSGCVSSVQHMLDLLRGSDRAMH
jgi:hypothetical protein